MIALALALLAPGPRFDAAFETGQRRQAGQQRRLNGGRLSVDHLFAGRWRISGGYVGRRETVIDVQLGDEKQPTTRREGPTLGAHQAGLVLGFEHRWAHVAAGLGFEASAGTDFSRETRWRPAGRLRLGPRGLVFVDAAAFDPSPWSPGPGRWRVGLGSRPGLSHLWAGAVRGLDGWALGGAVRIPIEGGLHLGVSAAVDLGAPGDYLVLQGGLGYTLGLQAPEGKGAPLSAPPSLQRPTRPPLERPDPKRVPL